MHIREPLGIHVLPPLSSSSSSSSSSPVLLDCTLLKCFATPSTAVPTLMGFSHGLGFWATLLFSFLFSLLLSYLPSPSLSQPILQPYTLPLAAAPPRQLFHVMKPRPYPSDGDLVKNSRTRRRRRRKKSQNGLTSRPFSAMLPRGFNVPPSGSSSCHNDVPNSVDFFCGDVSASNP